ncbi:hypothetical protein DVK17_005292 [Escherichia coli]|nr:hypothetical protein [Escherichia coli]
MEERTKQALADLVEALKEEEKPFDLPDIPDFPDDFNTDEDCVGRSRPETRILPTA